MHRQGTDQNQCSKDRLIPRIKMSMVICGKFLYKKVSKTCHVIYEYSSFKLQVDTFGRKNSVNIKVKLRDN